MRKLLVLVVVLAAILVGLDRASVYAVSQVLASKVQTQQHLSSKPSVVIHGFPFLTQVVGGRYDRVDVDASGVMTTDLRLDRVHVEASGIQIALSDAIHGTVRQVPVSQGLATVHLTFADLNAAIARQVGAVNDVGGVTVSSTAAGRVTLTGKVSALGQSASVSADAAVSVSSSTVSILPLPGAFDALPSALRAVAATALTVHLALPGLPFGIQLTGGQVNPGGVDLQATVTGAIFPVSR